MTRWLLLAGSLGLVACGRTPPGEPLPAPQPPPAQQPAEAPSPADAAGPAFIYVGWPGEGIPEFTATSDTTLELRSAPGGPTTATCALAADAPLAYTSSQVVTERSAPVRLEASRELPAGSVAYGGQSRLDPAAAQGTSAAGRRIGPDTVVYHLQYRAEGTCLYRIDDDVVETDCFHDPDASADTSWWVQTTCDGNTGWVRVDGRDDLRSARRF